MSLSENNILSLIPQRPPFVLIDDLTYSDDHSTKSVFVIPKNHILCEDGVFTEAGLMENIAQTAAARVGYICKLQNIPVPLGFIGAVKNLEIFAHPAAGDTLETTVTIEHQVFDVTVISGVVYCRNKEVAKCEMKIFISKNK